MLARRITVTQGVGPNVFAQVDLLCDELHGSLRRRFTHGSRRGGWPRHLRHAAMIPPIGRKVKLWMLMGESVSPQGL